MKHSNISIDSYKHVAIATIRDGDAVVTKLARDSGDIARAAADVVVAELAKPELPEIRVAHEIDDVLEEGTLWTLGYGQSQLLYRISVVNGLSVDKYSSDAEAFYPRIRAEVYQSSQDGPMGENLGEIPLLGGYVLSTKGGILGFEAAESSSKDFVHENLVEALRDALAAVRQIRADILSSETRIAEIQEEGCRRLRGLVTHDEPS